MTLLTSYLLLLLYPSSSRSGRIPRKNLWGLTAATGNSRHPTKSIKAL